MSHREANSTTRSGGRKPMEVQMQPMTRVESKEQEVGHAFKRRNVPMRGGGKKCPNCWKPIKRQFMKWFPNCCGGGGSDEAPPHRLIYHGESFPDDEFPDTLRLPHLANEELSRFCSNYISTTKYTRYTFVFVNLFEQFQKIANFYFLIIAILAFTPASPKNPVFSVAPLLMILSVSAAKEGYEDIKRFEMDKEVNNRDIEVYRPKAPESKQWEFVKIPWQELEVGDIVRVTKDAPAFAADLLLLQSSTPQGLCNIETANLDGETNLKIKQAVGATYSIDYDQEDGSDYPGKLDFYIDSTAPNVRMDKTSWKGGLFFGSDDGHQVAVGMNQMLLRGCTLRNTDWVIAMVMFTGVETKLMLNNQIGRFKRSNVDITVDKALRGVFVAQAFLCSFGSLMHYIWLRANGDQAWYQYINANGTPETNFVNQAGLRWFTFLVLIDLFVPISLYVSMEMTKFAQAYLINQDDEMMEDGVRAQARTSNLNEELGQINFVFSDKTGTLTENKMEFIKCHVNGVRYGPGEMEEQKQEMNRIETPQGMPAFDPNFCQFTDNRLAHQSRSDQIVDEFMTLLGTCHSIIPEWPDGRDGEVVYQAASPDEKALVVFAKNLHYYLLEAHVDIIEFQGRRFDGYTFIVNIFGEVYSFQVYNMLEFSSARKRMSVIVRDPRDGKLKVYCKGADNVMFARLREDQKNGGGPWKETLESLKTFAAEGLRTLVCGYKVISDEEYAAWLDDLVEAQNDVDHRDARVDMVMNQMEDGFVLLGATAIEDKLQKGVPETIANLSVANISVWVLTGDKVETAINIGRSCRLLTREMVTEDDTLIIIDIDEKLDDEEAKQLSQKALDDAWAVVQNKPDSDENQGLVISGKALGYVFPARKRDAKGRIVPPTAAELEEEARLQNELLRVCLKCRAVVACRVSPIQKAQVVQLVKENVPGTITLAIGDGANDVPMIKAAHVGIGISGQEGLQAVMASDYAICQFRFLQELLLVHGAWSYRRIAIIILYSFYKNIMFSMTQIWFAFYNGFSGVLYYDALSGSCYNMVFTALPVLFASTIDRPYSKEMARKLPELYWNGPANKSFNLRLFVVYQIQGVYGSMILMWVVTWAIDSLSLPTGETLGFWSSAVTWFSALVFAATAKMMLETLTWTLWSAIVFFGSLLSYFLVVLVYASLPPSLGWGNSDIYQVPHVVMRRPQFWFCIMIACVLILLPEIIVRYIRRMEFPERIDIVQELEKDPEGRLKFLREIDDSMERAKKNEDRKRDEDQMGKRASMSTHLGFSEFGVGRDHHDFLITQDRYMGIVLSSKKLKKLIMKGARSKSRKGGSTDEDDRKL